MISALYSEDRGGKPITDEKILQTVTELGRNPCKGEIVIFEKDNMTIGYSILIFYWSNEYGGTSYISMSCMSNRNIDDMAWPPASSITYLRHSRVRQRHFNLR